MVIVVDGNDGFYTSFSRGVPTSTSKHFDGVRFEIGDNKRVGEFETTGDDSSVGQYFYALSRTYSHLYVLFIIADSDLLFQDSLTIHDNGVVEGNHTRNNIVMHLRHPFLFAVFRSNNGIVGSDGSIVRSHGIKRTAIENKLFDTCP